MQSYNKSSETNDTLLSNNDKLAIIAEMDKNDLVDMLNRNAEEFLR